MKYLLKQNKEDKGILCEKVTIDGFDYYVSNEKYAVGENCIGEDEGGLRIHKCVILNNCLAIGCKKVIATNNPSIDIPKVVDEVEIEIFAWNEAIVKFSKDEGREPNINNEKDCFVVGLLQEGIIHGYNKSQETHPFSDDDMIGFNEFSIGLLHKQVNGVRYYDYDAKWITTKKLLKLWKSQQPQTIYYKP